jgi:alpha-galactosidase
MVLRFAALLFLAASLPAQITGLWTGTRMNGDGRSEPITLRLKAAPGGLLEGSVRISVGEVPIGEGHWSGETITFTTSIPFTPAPQITRYRGTISGTHLTITMERDNGRTKREGSAQRSSTEPGDFLRELPAKTPPRVPLPPNGLALLPPMGWNSWNHFGVSISDREVREIAEALVSTGMRDRGYNYVIIDDGWQGVRDSSGILHSNSRFPDMKALGEFLHSRRLEFGIYSSPGPKTCAGFEGSWSHEQQDARTFAAWGVDYLKYDWCTAGLTWDIRDMGEAYKKMAAALRSTGREIVFSVCQYGLFEPWKWASQAGGSLWRTTGDIGDAWASINSIGFNQDGLEAFAEPGRWNDPDMLEIGNGGMTTEEYRTHMTLWAMLAAPLIAGCDPRKIAPESLALLTNPEVIAIDQDPLGKQGRRVDKQRDGEVWVKPLANGEFALALFNRGDTPLAVNAIWKVHLGFAGSPQVRDLWNHKDEGPVHGGFAKRLEPHSCALYRIRP